MKSTEYTYSGNEPLLMHSKSNQIKSNQIRRLYCGVITKKKEQQKSKIFLNKNNYCTLAVKYI